MLSAQGPKGSAVNVTRCSLRDYEILFKLPRPVVVDNKKTNKKKKNFFLNKAKGTFCPEFDHAVGWRRIQK